MRVDFAHLAAGLKSLPEAEQPEAAPEEAPEAAAEASADAPAEDKKDQ